VAGLGVFRSGRNIHSQGSETREEEVDGAGNGLFEKGCGHHAVSGLWWSLGSHTVILSDDLLSSAS